MSSFCYYLKVWRLFLFYDPFFLLGLFRRSSSETSYSPVLLSVFSSFFLSSHNLWSFLRWVYLNFCRRPTNVVVINIFVFDRYSSYGCYPFTCLFNTTFGILFYEISLQFNTISLYTCHIFLSVLHWFFNPIKMFYFYEKKNYCKNDIL